MKYPVNTNRETKRADYLKQGGILAMASLLVRFIGLAYRIPMNNILGAKGVGIYGIAFDIYDLLLIISSYSLPLALSKIVSGLQARREYRNVGRSFQVALWFGIVSGGIFCLVLLLGAGAIEKYIYPEYAGVQIPLRVLAPTIFIVALLGVFRGFFQGKKTMMPTAFSQVIEQIVNAVVSVLASFYFMKWNVESLHQAAWGAAGGTLGTCMGAVSAFLILLFLYWVYRPIQMKQEGRDRTRSRLSYRYLLMVLLATILPVILSQTVYNITGLIDYKLFGSLSGGKGMDSNLISSLAGVYSGQYRLLCSVPIAISTAVASSMIPSAVAAYTEGDIPQWKKNVASGIKFNMVVAIPCAVGFSVLGFSVTGMLFSTSDIVLGIPAYVLGGRLLTVGSAAVVFYALSNVTGGALQSIDKMKLPVIHSLISLFVHIVVVSLLLKYTDMAVYALILGNVTFPMAVFALNLWAMKRYVPDYRQECVKTFLAPLAASVWMAVAVVVVYWCVWKIIPVNVVCTLLSVCVAVFVYFWVFLLLKGLTRDELLDFPMGQRLYLIAKRLHVMK